MREGRSLKKAINDALFRARGRNTQSEFARLVGARLGRGVTFDQVSEYETGRHMPPADYLVAAALVAGKPLDLLLWFGDPPPDA